MRRVFAVAVFVLYGLRGVGILLALIAFALAKPAAAQTEPNNGQEAIPTAEGPVIVLTIDGAIGPATTGYVIDELDAAAARGAQAVVLRIDTPGGLSASMREIIHKILATPMPVIGYVTPRGARAASAGTYILYATHVAAMAPGTTLGAATPVQMGGGSTPLPGAPPETPPEEGDPGNDAAGDDTATEDNTAAEDTAAEDKGTPSAPGDAKTAKAVNDAVAYIRALADLRGRNADWAERAVREAATLTVDQALAQNVIDMKAETLGELLATLDGQEIALDSGAKVTLATADAPVETVDPDWRDRLLAILTDPNIAFIFMTLGIYGLIFELSNPGAAVPGVLGAIFLMLGLYALNVLPVNYAGLALIALGIAFMTAEAFAPSFGVLGLGGLAAFALGATILFDTGSPEFTLSLWTVGTVTALTGAVLIILIGYLVKAHRRPVMTGQETLVGHRAIVEDWDGGQGKEGQGHVRVNGEMWQAVGPPSLAPGETVRVRALDGLTLTVAAFETAPPPSASSPPAL